MDKPNTNSEIKNENSNVILNNISSRNIKEDIFKIAKRLNLNTLANYSSIINNADPFEISLLKLLNAELTQKEERSITRRIKSAGFPTIKTIDTFEFDKKRMPHLNKEQLLSLTSCEFIEKKQNCIMVGNSGMGKSHASVALAIEGIKKGYVVKFKRASDIVNQMEEAQKAGTTTKYIKNLNSCHLLVIDELGYLNYDLAGASRLFQIFASRYETKSTIVTTNLEFSKWVNFLGDQTMATALIDRLVHFSTILNMNGESYRLKKARENGSIK
jgi:DNA replication protein DnaC